MDRFIHWEEIDRGMLATIAAILLLIVLSAFFSASETALTAANRARIHHLAGQGSRRAKAVEWLLDRRDELIGALLLGNNFANITASALATSVLIGLFGDTGVAWATALMTVLLLVFAEVMPKTFAINKPDRVALAVAPVVRVVLVLLSPIVRAVKWIVEGTFRLFGADISPGEGQVTAAQELRSSLDLHVQDGAMVRAERDMLGSILDLAEYTVGDIMVHRQTMHTLDIGQAPAAIVEQVLASGHTRLPVWRDNPDNIVGVLHARDLLREISRHGLDTSRLDVAKICAEPWFVPNTTSLRAQLGAFRQRRAHFALVVDEYGVPQGLVTLEDILEEIVGDIRDEHDKLATGIRPQADGAWLVDGGVTIRDLNRALDWHLPDEDFATVAGLVIHEARTIPAIGQSFIFHDRKFDVVRRQGNRLAQLRIALLPALGDGAV
jgi:Mg2+/Co2+ transporter CorB